MKRYPASAIFRAAILVVLVLAAGGFTFRLADPAIRNLLTPASERYRNEGDIALADKRLPEAILSYRQAVEADPGNTRAVQALADAYTAQGRKRMATRYRTLLPARDATPITSLTDLPASGPVLAWITAPVEASPTGAAFLPGKLITAYEDGSVIALQAGDGQQAWRVILPQALVSSPGTDGQRVYLGGQDGTVYALSASTGASLWVAKPGGPVYAAPFSDGERVFFPSMDGRLYALKAEDGSLLWKFSTPGQLHGTPTLDNGRLFFGSSDGKLYAVEALTGAPLWQDGIQTGGMVESQPLISGGRLFFGSSDGRLYALAPESGGEYWRFSTADAIYAAPVIQDQVVYAASSGATLTALDFLDGKKTWQAAFGGMLRNPPAIAGEILYQLVDSDPNIYWLDRQSGKILGKVDTGDWTAAGPWIEGSNLLLLGKDGAVLAYHLPR